ncbi:MAG: NAD-dependent epimerase/dehydratase family protein [Acidithiobacillus sp.]|uniref:NAD-dependent epimerase/dehydratase family protein n=1 Tax=Acidithiobacillus sp. TaxID=1872118 RepID=UPI003CFDEB86
MRILVTGAAGHMGRLLVAELLHRFPEHELLALDRVAVHPTHPRLRCWQRDLRDPDLPVLLAGVDLVIHLAFVVLSPHLGWGKAWRERMAASNREGTRALLEAMRTAGVHRLIYSSSVAVYGAWPDNPAIIDEQQRLRPNPGFAYAEDKVAVEGLLDEHAASDPRLRITRLRLHAIVGPQAQPLVNNIATSPFGLRLPDPGLPLQCIHEQDAIGAVLAALTQDRPGAYNIAAPDPIPWSSIPRRWSLPLSPRQMHEIHRRLRPLVRAMGDPGWLLGLEHPLVVDCRKAEAELGWRARYDVAQAIASVRGESLG